MPPLRLLMVCTANICRSPMAEVLLARDLQRVGVPAEVSSAGFLRSGERAHRQSIATMHELGLDLKAHRSRRLTEDLLQDHDVVLTMERRHVRDILLPWPQLAPRCHTLQSLVEHPGPAPGDDLAAWLATLAAARRPIDLLGEGPDDIADPLGGSRRDFRRTADLLTTCTAEVARRLAAIQP